MQKDLEMVAEMVDAAGIDMQEPLREVIDEVLAKDKIHPDKRGAKIIAEATFNAVMKPKVYYPYRRWSIYDSEFWLCAGQSNMQKGWGEFNATAAEKARVKSEMERLKKVDVYFWDFNTGETIKLTPENKRSKKRLNIQR